MSTEEQIIVSGNRVIAPQLEYTAPVLVGDSGAFKTALEKINHEGAGQIYRLTLTSTQDGATPDPIKVTWQLPAINVKGIWTSGALFEKRLRADWEEPDVESRISVNTPVISLFGHQDENRITFACSDACQTARLAAPVREEDNLIYCSVELFTETVEEKKEYTIDLLIDTEEKLFSDALLNVGKWWGDGLGDQLAPSPAAASDAVYSTWYAYHQEMTPDQLLGECRLASDLGYGTIILDDGWQTMDNQRGYDYTGDWEAERFTEMAAFVADVQELGMKTMVWYSVPFCGHKSRAYQRFKGKFLTENHRWAPVFDPRYPEVRDYLVGKYRDALIDWKLDGFKLDFIDDFRMYPETPQGKANGRDFASVNDAVLQLITDIAQALRSEKQDVLIEFRQKYIGPELRRLGNMFRAFDCPNDSATNRLRTTDVRLLIDNHYVHSDMFTWHPEEAVEVAALQFNAIFFSVPQISVRLNEQPEDKLNMIRFYTKYYNENRDILLHGDFRPMNPQATYTQLHGTKDSKSIVGLYANEVVDVTEIFSRLDIINGKLDERVMLEVDTPFGNCTVTVWNCEGNTIHHSTEDIDVGVHVFEVPASGVLRIERE